MPLLWDNNEYEKESNCNCRAVLQLQNGRIVGGWRIYRSRKSSFSCSCNGCDFETAAVSFKHSLSGNVAKFECKFLRINRAGEPSPSLSGATGLHNEASYRPYLSGQPTSSDLVLPIRKHVLETKAADAMLNNLNDEGIKFIKVLELTGRIMFQRRRWSESEIDIVLLDDHVWTRGERTGSRRDQHRQRLQLLL